MASSSTNKIVGTFEMDEFFIKCAFKMGWRDLSNDVVMDVGCGVGNSSVCFCKHFPTVKRVVGIDYDKNRILTARNQNPHPKIEYEVGDIDKRSSLNRWKGKISKIVSVYCIQQSEDQNLAFQNIYDLLQCGGEAAMLYSLQSGFFDWFADIASDAKWISYSEGVKSRRPESNFKKLGASHYKKILEEIGFTVTFCQEDKRLFRYANAAHCKNTILSSCPMTSKIPLELEKEFKEDAYQIFLKHNEIDEEKRPTVWNTVIMVVVKK